MTDIDKEIEETKEKLKKTPVNKATETERARLKSKIAKLESQKEKRQKGGGGGRGYSVKKKGDATVSLVGLPSTGKSTLLNKLTNADSEVGSYEFTTLDVVPGIMKYKGAQIQILDVPGLIGGAAEGKGRGKEVLAVVRNSDMVVILLNQEDLEDLKKMEKELYDAGLRLNTEEPNMEIMKRTSGGIEISSIVDLELEEETLKEILREHGYINCRVIIREEVDLDKFIDGIMENRVYLPSITVMNKVDNLDSDELKNLKEEHPEFVFISAKEEENLKELREKIWNKLEIMRVYMKRRGKEADKEEPLIIQKSSTIQEVCEKIHDNFKKNLDYARIWGPSSKFPGQRVGEDHVLKDEDVLELHF